MKIVKLTLGLGVILVTLYFSYFWLLPSVTVINQSQVTLESVKIRLPQSNLDFGALTDGQSNTIYYDLSQQDGSYQIELVSIEGPIKWHCGHVTQNEVHKRVNIVVNSDMQVSCHGGE